MLALGHQVCEDVPVSGGQAPRVAVRAYGPRCLTDAPGFRGAVLKPTGLAHYPTYGSALSQPIPGTLAVRPLHHVSIP